METLIDDEFLSSAKNANILQMTRDGALLMTEYTGPYDEYICMLGVATNTLSMLVLLRRFARTRSCAAFFFALLTLSDLLYVASILAQKAIFTGERWERTPTWGRYLYVIWANEVYLLTSWSAELMTFDRYLHICWPLLSRRYNLLHLGYINTAVTVATTTVAIVTITCYYGNRDAYPVSQAIIGALAAAPYPGIVILNTLVIRAMYKYNHSNTTNRVKQPANNNIIRPSIIIVKMTVMYLLLRSPQAFGMVVYYFVPFRWVDIAVPMVYATVLNCSLKFFFCVTVCNDFRKDTKELLRDLGNAVKMRFALCCCCREGEDESFKPDLRRGTLTSTTKITSSGPLTENKNVDSYIIQLDRSPVKMPRVLGIDFPPVDESF